MPKVLEILKQRWPEATLVIVFQAGLFVLLDQLTAITQPSEQVARNSGSMILLLTAGTTCFAVICMMLNLGFVTTAYYEGCQRQEPGHMVVVGRYFFWRMIRFQILFGMGYLALVFFLSSLTGKLSGKEMTNIPQWILLVAPICLLKPLLLTPAVMIVRDYVVFPAFGSLREFRLMQVPGLLLAFISGFVMIWLLSFVLSQMDNEGIWRYIMVGIYSVVWSSVTLILTLAAIRFVATQTASATEQVEAIDEE